MVEQPELIAILAASSLVFIPPVPYKLVSMLAIFNIFLSISSTNFNNLADLFFFGFDVYNPATSLNSIKKSESLICATLAASLSLSPNFSSSIATESFSLIIGSTPNFSSSLIVSLELIDFFLSSVSE